MNDNIKIYNVIENGTIVEIHNKLKLKTIAIQIKGNDVDYRVCGFNEDGNYLDFWVNQLEITSIHKKKSIINQCIS